MNEKYANKNMYINSIGFANEIKIFIRYISGFMILARVIWNIHCVCLCVMNELAF